MMMDWGTSSITASKLVTNQWVRRGFQERTPRIAQLVSVPQHCLKTLPLFYGFEIVGAGYNEKCRYRYYMHRYSLCAWLKAHG